jgi:hypothetical protein
MGCGGGGSCGGEVELPTPAPLDHFLAAAREVSMAARV